MDLNLKKVAAIHDLSGFGRASLTTIIPTLAAMGIQTCPVPTAILSTQSSGFDNYTFKDLTDIMPEYIEHWKKLNLEFDCIYSGFLGSPKQIEIVKKMIDDFRKEKTLVVVDPVLGDNGELYTSVAQEMIPAMKQLVGKADIIVPNFTEAKMLLGIENFSNDNLTLDIIKDWLKKISELGPKIVMITSVSNVNDMEFVDVFAYEKESDKFWRVPTKLLPANYPGTGDLFASVLVGNLLLGENLPVAILKAVQFVYQCIQASRGYDYPDREGVIIERELPLLKKRTILGSYYEV